MDERIQETCLKQFHVFLQEYRILVFIYCVNWLNFISAYEFIFCFIVWRIYPGVLISVIVQDNSEYEAKLLKVELAKYF